MVADPLALDAALDALFRDGGFGDTAMAEEMLLTSMLAAAWTAEAG